MFTVKAGRGNRHSKAEERVNINWDARINMLLVNHFVISRGHSMNSDKETVLQTELTLEGMIII